MPFKKGTSGNP